jgi:hypothetical protein
VPERERRRVYCALPIRVSILSAATPFLSCGGKESARCSRLRRPERPLREDRLQLRIFQYSDPALRVVNVPLSAQSPRIIRGNTITSRDQNPIHSE